MSLNILFINETLIKSRVAISEAIDGKQIKPAIKLAQDKYILPALGSGLYNRLQEGIEANDLTNDERVLLNNYITDSLVWFTVGELVTMTSYQFFSKGVLQKTAEESNAPSKGQLELIERKYISNGEFYKQRLIDYLKENYELFFTYLNPGTGLDVIFPVNKGYTSPIYLGRNKEERDNRIISGGMNGVTPAEVSYVVTGVGDTLSFTVLTLVGRTLISVTRNGLTKIRSNTPVSDLNYLQVSNGVVYAPTGDIFQVGETFTFIYR